MNFNNKIKELQDQAKMLEQQAYLMLVMQGASGNGVQCTLRHSHLAIKICLLRHINLLKKI